MIRKSVSAGKMYPYDKAQLKDTISSLFGEEPCVKASKDVVCGVCPHAGYIYSGRTAAHFYSSLAQGMPSRFIVVGPNHYGIGSAIALMNDGSWETPLGEIPIDTALADKILDSSELISNDPYAHSEESSLEVQLPFLQSLRDDITFVPISLNLQDLDSAIEVAQAIKNSAKDNVGIIASSDLVHFGNSYGYVPFVGKESETLEWIERNDRQVLTMIVEKDVDGLYDFIASLNYTMCGYGPVAAAMIVASNFRLEGSMLNYATSYDVSKDSELVVGYGSVIFR
ncbi:MAG: AmmeMemoRadiSam system protein B [Candidatus Methanofastidiosia archaeon]